MKAILIILVLAFASVCLAQNSALQNRYYKERAKAALETIDKYRQQELDIQKMKVNSENAQMLGISQENAEAQVQQAKDALYNSQGQNALMPQGEWRGYYVEGAPEAFKRNGALIDSAFMCYGRHFIGVYLKFKGAPDDAGFIGRRAAEWQRCQNFMAKARAGI